MSDEKTALFLARLWELQAEAGIRNAELSRALGCDPSYIRHLKAGRRKRIGLDFVLSAARRFPALSSFLLAEFPTENDNVPPGNEGAEGASQ